MTENTTSDGTTVQPVAPPTPAMPVGTPTTPSTPASQPVSDNWYDKYNGLQGYIKTYKEQTAQQIEGLKATNTDYETQIEQLRQTVQGNEAILAELPTLKETLSTREQELAATQAKLERTNLLLKHGVRDDALTALVLSAQLPTEELETILENVTKNTAQQQAAAIDAAASGSVPATTAPAGGGGTTELQSLKDKADAAMRAGNYDGPDGFWALNRQWAELREELSKATT